MKNKTLFQLRLITKAALEMQLLVRCVCTNKVTLYFNLVPLLIKRKTTPNQMEITRC